MNYPVLHWAGDSTVKQNNINRYPQTGIGQLFGLFLKPEIIIRNYAENGRSTKSFLEEGRADAIDENLSEGDFLFIQFGHNDEKSADPSRFTEPFGEYTDNLKFFINLAGKHKAYPVLITSLYRRQFEENGKLRANTHLDYPKAMLELAKKENVPCIDLCSLSKAAIEEAGSEATKEWFMNISDKTYKAFDVQTDNTHLQPTGAIVFGSLIADELSKLGKPYSNILIPLEEASCYRELTMFSNYKK